MSVLVTGINHKTAPVAFRARFVFADAEVTEALSAIRTLPGVDECLLLSTCNRTEVYTHTSHDPSAAVVQRALCDLKRLPAISSSACMALDGAGAVQHAFRVAAGLESMVVGEAQILGQVRRAYETARDRGVTGPVLNRLMQLAIAAGKRVRRETPLGARSVSAAHAAMSACRQVLGSIAGRRILIVGAGEMAALVVKVFTAAGARIAVVANRTLDDAHLLAGRAGARPVSLTELPSVTTEIDAMIVAVGALDPILRHDHVRVAAGRIPPLVIVDLGVPRGVEAEVAALPGVMVYDMDALSDVLPSIPSDAVTAAERIVDDAADRFMRWYASRAAEPIIAALRHRAERIAEQTYAQLRPRLPLLDARSQGMVRAAMHTALRRLLHGPTVRLRETAADGEVLQLARELFDLNGDVEGDHS